MKNIIIFQNSKIFIFVFSVFFSSCKIWKYKTNQDSLLIQNAVKCVLEYNYLHKEKKAWPPKILIHPQVLMSKFNAPISTFKGYKNTCGKIISDSSFIKRIPTTTPYLIDFKELKDNEDKKSFNGDFIFFSPLLSTKNKNEFCILCEINNYESSSTFLYLLKKKQTKEFEIIKTIDGIITNY